MTSCFREVALTPDIPDHIKKYHELQVGHYLVNLPKKGNYKLMAPITDIVVIIRIG